VVKIINDYFENLEEKILNIANLFSEENQKSSAEISGDFEGIILKIKIYNNL